MKPLLVCAVLLWAGCAVRQKPVGAWRFQPLERGDLLVPPAPPRMAGEFQVLTLKNARHRGGPGCAIPGATAALDWRGRTAVIKVSVKVLAPPQEVTLSGPLNPKGETLPELAWFAEFQRKLAALENSCLAGGEAGALADRVIDHLTLPSALAYQLRYGDYVRAGHFDLGTEFRLKTIAPVLKPGVTAFRTGEDAAAWETAWFDIERHADGSLRTRTARVELNTGAKRAKASTAAALKLPANAHYLRMFFRTWTVSRERKLALLAASKAGQLDLATARFEANPEGYCQAPEPAGIFCVTIPMDTTLSAELKASANGRLYGVSIRANLQELLRTAGVKDPQTVLGSVTVRRPYGAALLPVEFDRGRPEILNLALAGGEEVTW